MMFELGQKLMRYAAASAFSVLMTLALPIVLVEWASIVPEVSTALCLIIAFFVNFCLLKFFVYRSKAGSGAELIKFAGFSLLFRLSEYGVFLLLYKLAGAYYIYALFGVLLTSSAIKYVVYGRWLFKDAPSTRTP